MFTKFPELPVELRLVIWKLSYPRGRVIIVDIVEASVRTQRLSHLTVCREARNLALEEYQLKELHTTDHDQVYHVHISYTNDIVFLLCRHVYGSLLSRPKWCWLELRNLTYTSAVWPWRGVLELFASLNHSEDIENKGEYLIILSSLQAEVLLEDEFVCGPGGELRSTRAVATDLLPTIMDATLLQYDPTANEYPLCALDAWIERRYGSRK